SSDLVFHAIIIPKFRLLQPPFMRDAFGTVRFGDFTHLAFIMEKHGRIIRNGSRNPNRLRTGKQVDWSPNALLPGNRRLPIIQRSFPYRAFRPVVLGREITPNGTGIRLSGKPVQQFRKVFIDKPRVTGPAAFLQPRVRLYPFDPEQDEFNAKPRPDLGNM